MILYERFFKISMRTLVVQYFAKFQKRVGQTTCARAIMSDLRDYLNNIFFVQQTLLRRNCLGDCCNTVISMLSMCRFRADRDSIVCLASWQPRIHPQARLISSDKEHLLAMRPSCVDLYKIGHIPIGQWYRESFHVRRFAWCNMEGQVAGLWFFTLAIFCVFNARLRSFVKEWRMLIDAFLRNRLDK